MKKILLMIALSVVALPTFASFEFSCSAPCYFTDFQCRDAKESAKQCAFSQCYNSGNFRCDLTVMKKIKNDRPEQSSSRIFVTVVGTDLSEEL